MGTRVGLVVLALLAVCCGTSPAALPDAGLDAADGAGLEWPLPPAPPAAPGLASCPMGWREVADETGLVTCDPWPETGRRDDCAFDEAHFPGTPGCARVGTACPSDGWPEGLPSDRPIVFVDDDAAPGGDGTSRDGALATIGDALARAADGAVIALAVGRYDEAVMLTGSRTLWGACVGGTRLTSSAPADDLFVVHVVGAGATMRNLGIDAPERAGIGLSSGAALVEDVVVSQARTAAIWAWIGAAELQRIVVRATRPRSSDGQRGRGLVVSGGAMVNVADFVADQNADAGLFVFDASTSLEGHRVAVRGGSGRGVDVQGGAQALLESLVAEEAYETGVLASGDATRVEVRDAVVRDTRELNGRGGFGAQSIGGATLLLERVLAERNIQAGLIVSGASSRIDARDLVVRSTMPRAMTPGYGRGIVVQSGGQLGVERARLTSNRAVGLLVTESTSFAQAFDLVIADTLAERDGEGGMGISVESGARLVVERAIIERNTQAGLAAHTNGTMVEARDLVVRDTRPRSVAPSAGRGVDVHGGATVTIERALLERNRDAAIVASGDATYVRAVDVLLQDTMARSDDLLLGAGAFVQHRARLVLSRSRVLRARFAGVASVNGADVSIDEVAIAGVLQSDCALTTCPSLAGGFGVSAHFGAALVANRFSIEDAVLCGAVIGANDRDGTLTAMDLSDGSITRTVIGACVQVEGYDTARLRNNVEYREVEIPSQATAYEVPEGIPEL